MSWLKYFKWRIMSFLGIQPKLSDITLNNLREKHTEKIGDVPTPTPRNMKCNYTSCRKMLTGLTYKCPYCHKRFCSKHRLPEDHNCPNPQLPEEMRIGWGKKHVSAEKNAIALAEKN